jgi:uncharacterized repeat protein (TIGR01451 family)
MKKRIRMLLPILVILAMLVSMFGMVLPVMASQVTLAIDPSPLTPNIYRIGDTITYNCSVTNPSVNTHTNNYTLVEAILPDGTHVVFTTSLIQAPGESNSWTTTYNVTLADVIADSPDYVEAALNTDGRDSANGRLLSIVYCDSTIIQPGIDIEKYVSVDGGTTWLDADSATGPYAAVGSDVKFYVAVNNTGNVELTNIVVGDTDFTFTGIASTLAAGASDTSDVVTISAVAGQQYDLADVRGTPPVGANVTDSDPAYYFGSAPNIDIEKYVSVDGGTTWLDADSATGPYAAVGSDVKFYVAVNNTGNVELTNIVVGDTDFTFTGIASTLAAGASDTSDVVTISAVAGQQYDLADVRGTPPVGANVTDSDPAYYFGQAQQCTGCLKICKFEDKNGNGKKDCGEAYLSGWTFNVTDSQGNSQLVTTGGGGGTCGGGCGYSVTTGCGGGTSCGGGTGCGGCDYCVTICNLTAGEYTITEISQAGWTCTTGNPLKVTVVCDQTTTVNFGNQKQCTGCLKIYKYNDKNGNGKKDCGEAYLSGWTFNVTDSQGNSQLVTTGTGGYVTISNLLPGQYTITETLKAGWTCTTGNPRTVTVVCGKTTTVSFGNQRPSPGCLKIYKYNDKNGNGQKDCGEAYLSGWVFNVTDSQGNSQLVTTGTGGYVTISNLLPGQYTITETLKAGWTCTTGNPLNNVAVVSGKTTTVYFGNKQQ